MMASLQGLAACPRAHARPASARATVCRQIPLRLTHWILANYTGASERSPACASAQVSPSQFAQPAGPAQRFSAGGA